MLTCRKREYNQHIYAHHIPVTNYNALITRYQQVHNNGLRSPASFNARKRLTVRPQRSAEDSAPLQSKNHKLMR